MKTQRHEGKVKRLCALWLGGKKRSYAPGYRGDTRFWCESVIFFVTPLLGFFYDDVPKVMPCARGKSLDQLMVTV